MKDDLTLERMWPLLKRAGNPHKSLSVIHAAGTSGKTSTCYYVSELLRASGKKVGLTVSPHILSITERIQINTSPLSEKQFCEYLEEFDALMGSAIDEQSYFEFMIVFALWVFVKEEVDYAVVETGLGGLFDSTNVVSRNDKVCVITDIGFDHQHILGSTIQDITTQKAGIIHERNHVIFHEQSNEVMSVIKKQMKLKNATYTSVSKKNGVKYEGLPDYQKRNFGLAKTTAEYVAKRDGFELSEIDPREVVVPGRMHAMYLEDKKLIIDGAHNPQKMKAFVASIMSLYPDIKFDIVLAMRMSKDYEATMRELAPITRNLICCELTSKGVDSVPAEVIGEMCRKLGMTCIVEKDITKATYKSATTPTIVTGSLYLLSALKKQA